MTTKTLIIAAALLAGTAYAQTVDVKDAWVRTSVPGQKATGAFMKLPPKMAPNWWRPRRRSLV
jgi:copper(I)-binding protein